MEKLKVLVTDSIYDGSIEKKYLERVNAELVYPNSTGKEDLIAAGKKCDGIFCDYVKLNREILEEFEKCKIIVEAGIGVNNIDIEAAAQQGIKVANIPLYCLSEVADHTMALALASIRKVALYDRDIKKGTWDRMKWMPIHRLAGYNFCLFGLGKIAQKVAARAKAFEMEVYAYDPFISDEVFEELGVRRVGTIRELAESADIFSIHAPLTEETKECINKEIFAEMKAKTVVINTSRGGLICEEDLILALQNRQIAAAGLDVFEKEPLEKTSPFLTMDHVLLTPHIGFYSEEAEQELRITMAKEMARGLAGDELESWVNRKYFV